MLCMFCACSCHTSLISIKQSAHTERKRDKCEQASERTNTPNERKAYTQFFWPHPVHKWSPKGEFCFEIDELLFIPFEVTRIIRIERVCNYWSTRYHLWTPNAHHHLLLFVSIFPPHTSPPTIPLVFCSIREFPLSPLSSSISDAPSSVFIATFYYLSALELFLFCFRFAIFTCMTNNWMHPYWSKHIQDSLNIAFIEEDRQLIMHILVYYYFNL